MFFYMPTKVFDGDKFGSNIYILYLVDVAGNEKIYVFYKETKK